jgi:hypothetical protein
MATLLERLTIKSNQLLFETLRANGFEHINLHVIFSSAEDTDSIKVKELLKLKLFVKFEIYLDNKLISYDKDLSSGVKTRVKLALGSAVEEVSQEYSNFEFI